MSPRDLHDDFHRDPLPGLPEVPPEGERILWQGRPAWRALAWRAMGIRLVLVYFAAIALWRGIDMWAQGAGAGQIALGVGALGVLALAAVAVLALLGWATARTTVYTITNRRLAMRIGVALTLTINLPFRWIGSASMKLHRDGTADIPLVLSGRNELAYLMLWPHARPWQLRRTEPMLRAVPEGGKVAELLVAALRAEAARRADTETAEVPGDAPAPARPATAPGLVAAE